MSEKIYVIGETLIDIVHNQGDPVEKSEKFLGGSPANIAVTLGRLEKDITLITALSSSDELGKFALEQLKKSNVKVSKTSTNAPKTYTATAEVDGAGHATYEFDYLEEIDIEPLSKYTDMQALHAGSLSTHQLNYGPKILEFYKEAHKTAKTFYDPNIRPTIIPDRDFVRSLTEDFIRETDVAKVSDEDLEWLYPGVPILKSAQKWRDLGAKIVVVTQGGDGATALFSSTRSVQQQPENTDEDSQQVHVDTPKVKVADTVGAGDSFMGALISQLADADLGALTVEKVQQTLEFAARVAGITVSREGANPPFLSEVL